MKAKTKSNVRIRVLRECTTQWSVFAYEHDGHGTQLEEPIGAIAMDGARFVPFLALWTADGGKPNLNEVKQTCDTLKEAVAAILLAKQNAEQFIREALAKQSNGVIGG
jgi:hypothetical protein